MADEDLAPGRRQSGTAPLPQEQSRVSISGSSLGDRTMPQSRLHNFSFPSMSWGSQRLLRCVKVEPRGAPPCSDDGSTPMDDLCKRRRIEAAPSVEKVEAQRVRDRTDEELEGRGEDRREGDEEDERLENIRESMIAESPTALDRIPLPASVRSPPPVEYKEVRDREPSPSVAGVEVSRPWNLRLRRAACNAPAALMDNGLQNVRKRNQSPMPQEKNLKAMNCADQMLRLEEDPERKQRPKFSLTLSKDEIAEDFFVMTGSKPPRRSKKRPRNAQKQIEMLLPGFFLREVTPDLYKIREGK